MQATALEASMYFLYRVLICLSTSVEAVHYREERGNLFSDGHLYIDKEETGSWDRRKEERGENIFHKNWRKCLRRL